MKNKLKMLTIATLCLCASVVSSQAQTNSTQVPNLLPPMPTISGGLTEIWNAVETTGLTTATNYAVEPYLTYANNAPSGSKIGGGLFLCYNVSQYIGTGLGFDYLGQWSLVSANVQLKVATHPFASLGTSWATNLVVAPFVIGGLGTALSGGISGAIAVTDMGAYVEFGNLWGGKFNLGAAYGRWDNAGIYSGPREHFFGGWSKGF